MAAAGLVDSGGVGLAIHLTIVRDSAESLTAVSSCPRKGSEGSGAPASSEPASASSESGARGGRKIPSPRYSSLGSNSRYGVKGRFDRWGSLAWRA